MAQAELTMAQALDWSRRCEAALRAPSVAGARVDRQPPGRPVTTVLWSATVPLVRPRGGSSRAPPRAGDASELSRAPLTPRRRRAPAQMYSAATRQRRTRPGARETVRSRHTAEGEDPPKATITWRRGRARSPGTARLGSV